LGTGQSLDDVIATDPSGTAFVGRVGGAAY
jgi:hypothetical protein